MFDRFLRWPPFPGALQIPLLAATVAIAFLAVSSPRRSEMNVGAALVWQLWWPFLPFFILLSARLWCAVCPFATAADLAQRLRSRPLPSIPPRRRPLAAWMGAGSIALLGFLFLLLSLESNGPLTAALLVAFAVGAAATALLWRGRVWCRYLCPLGLMAGLYSRLAWLRLEVAGGQGKVPAVDVRGCPVFTSPLSARRAQDCVLCANCLKAPGGEAVAVRFGRPSPAEGVLTSPEAVALSLLMGLLLADAVRMVPAYLRYMAWAVPRTGGDYERAMALGIAGVVVLLLLGQAAATLLSSGGRWSWPEFARLSLALLPLALATQLALSAQHLMAAGEVVRNLGAELGLLAPGHMPPADAYVVVWPLKALQGAMLLAGVAASLYVARGREGRLARPAVAMVALGGLALAAVFASPMSVTC